MTIALQSAMHIAVFAVALIICTLKGTVSFGIVFTPVLIIISTVLMITDYVQERNLKATKRFHVSFGRSF